MIMNSKPANAPSFIHLKTTQNSQENMEAKLLASEHLANTNQKQATSSQMAGGVVISTQTGVNKLKKTY